MEEVRPVVQGVANPRIEDRNRTEQNRLDSKMTGFPGLMVEHFYVKFGDPSCIVF